jgi:hypothetical protein
MLRLFHMLSCPQNALTDCAAAVIVCLKGLSSRIVEAFPFSGGLEALSVTRVEWALYSDRRILLSRLYSDA